MGIPPGRILFLQVPLARFIPAEADRASGHHGFPALCVDANGLPVGVGRLAQAIGEVGCPEHPVGHVAAVLFNQPHQHGHVGVLTDVILEVPRLTVDMELAQDDVSHGHGEGRIGALLGMQPQIGELGRLRVIRADDHRLGAVVPGLGIEVGVGGSGLRDVGPPQHEEPGIVPVRAFGNVRLLTPGLRRGRRQIAVPVVKRHADAAHERQVPRPRGVGDHGHGRNRREADHPVGSMGFRRIGICRGDDLVHLIPRRADEPAEAALFRIGRTLLRVLDNGCPRGHGGLDRAGFAPQLDQPRADKRVFHPVAGIEVPGVAGPPGTTARLVVGQVRAGAGIVGLLGLPGHDAALHIDLPGTRARAVGAVGGPDDLVMLPTASVSVLPIPVFAAGHPVTIGELADVGRFEEVQSVQKMAHGLSPSSAQHGTGALRRV